MEGIHELQPRKWGLSEPVVAINVADGSVAFAQEMARSAGTAYYDHYGFNGSRQIVCIDCLEDGSTVPVVLVETRDRGNYFRHPPGASPWGKGQHGETAQHVQGKRLLANWARNQECISPGSVREEHWLDGARLRSDVGATLNSGVDIAFELQRSPLDRADWARRHGGYNQRQVVDIWLWSPTVVRPVVGPPGCSVVIDIERKAVGVLLCRGGEAGYIHPTALRYPFSPSFFALAPLEQWGMLPSGEMKLPASLQKYILPG